MRGAAERRSDVVAREDLLLFINACFAYTGQRAFYGAAEGHTVSFEFLHDYILINHRRLYALTLAAGIGHFAQARILFNLLLTGRDVDPALRAEENALCTRALAQLPPQRVYRLFRQLRRSKVNNRRTRALFKAWFLRRPDPAFDALKYRGHLRAATRHTHLPLPGELGTFLRRGVRASSYRTPLFETFRRAHYDTRALFELPITVAEGLAQARGVSRATLLAHHRGAMTGGEALRRQGVAEAEGIAVDVDLGRQPLSRLCAYALSLDQEARRAREGDLEDALRRAAARAAGGRKIGGRVALILDRSYSARGGRDTRRRPLAVALGAAFLVREMAEEALILWTPAHTGPDLFVTPSGQTDLATPLLSALHWGPELVLFLSDGVENDPPEASHALLRRYRRDLDPEGEVGIVHLNPVMDALDYQPRSLSHVIPTVALRDPEDLPASLAFARLSGGDATLGEVIAFLRDRADLGGAP